jgi:hypothetical protein
MFGAVVVLDYYLTNLTRFKNFFFSLWPVKLLLLLFVKLDEHEEHKLVIYGHLKFSFRLYFARDFGEIPKSFLKRYLNPRLSRVISSFFEHASRKEKKSEKKRKRINEYIDEIKQQ